MFLGPSSGASRLSNASKFVSNNQKLEFLYLFEINLSKWYNFFPGPPKGPFLGPGLIFLYRHFQFELGAQKKCWTYFRKILVQKKILCRAGHPHAEISAQLDSEIAGFWPKISDFGV
jgi:hypothetical protein